MYELVYVEPILATIAAGASIAQGAASIYNVLTGAGERRKLNRTNRRLRGLLSNQERALEGTRPSIEAFSEELLSRESERADLRQEGAFERFLQESENITNRFEDLTDRTGLASSPVQEQFVQNQQALNRSFSNLIDRDRERTQTNLLNILTRREDQLSSLDDQIFQLQTEQVRLS